jgi:hypothetical protein
MTCLLFTHSYPGTDFIPPMDRKSYHPTFTSVWKETLVNYFHPFMAFFFPDILRDTAPMRGFERLDEKLLGIAAEPERADLEADSLIRVWCLDGEERWLLIHFEVEGPPKVDFARQMFVTNAGLFDQYGRTVASLLIMAADNPDRPPLGFGYELLGTKVEFKPRVLKLADCYVDLSTLEGKLNPVAVVACAYRKAVETANDDRARRRAKVALVKALHAREMRSGQICQLYRLIDGMLVLPESQAERAWQELCDFEREIGRQYITDPEDVGHKAGWAEVLNDYRRQIESVLLYKFGDPGLALLPKIRQIQDVVLLRKMIVALDAGGGLEALRLGRLTVPDS